MYLTASHFNKEILTKLCDFGCVFYELGILIVFFFQKITFISQIRGSTIRQLIVRFHVQKYIK